MNLNEFVAKYEGQTVGYPDGSYVGECLSIVKRYILECFNLNPPPSGSGSAYGYWSNFPDPLGEVFKKVENTVDGVPKRGDIVIWQPWSTNQYGHIDIFLDGNEFWFNGFDQNWGGRHAHKVTHDYKNVVGWLTPKGIMYTEEEMTAVRLERDQNWNLYQAALAEANRLQKQIDEHECPIIPAPEPDDEWIANGKTETFVKDGITTTINYAVKG